MKKSQGIPGRPYGPLKRKKNSKIACLAAALGPLASQLGPLAKDPYGTPWGPLNFSEFFKIFTFFTFRGPIMVVEGLYCCY